MIRGENTEMKMNNMLNTVRLENFFKGAKVICCVLQLLNGISKSGR